MTVDDGATAAVRRQKHYVIALAIRDGLLFALIVHAVTTVLMSPRRNR